MKALNTLLDSMGYREQLEEFQLEKPETDDLEARLTYAEKVLGIQPEEAAEPVSDKPEELVVDTGADSVPAAEVPEEVATDD